MNRAEIAHLLRVQSGDRSCCATCARCHEIADLIDRELTRQGDLRG